MGGRERQEGDGGGRGGRERSEKVRKTNQFREHQIIFFCLKKIFRRERESEREIIFTTCSPHEFFCSTAPKKIFSQGQNCGIMCDTSWVLLREREIVIHYTHTHHTASGKLL